MAKRKWIVKWHYGYAGTDNEEPVDYLGKSEKEVSAMTDNEVESELYDQFWHTVIDQVACWAEPDED